MEAAQEIVTEINPSQTLRSVLLQDRTGRVQAILPADAMLDLRAVQEETGRDFQPVCRSELSELISKQRISPLPSFAPLNHCTSLIDTSISASQLEFLIPHEDTAPQRVTLDRGELKSALLSHEQDLIDMQISVSAGELDYQKPDRTADQEQIVASVRNFTTRRIKQRLEDTLEIPTLPQTAQRIIQLRADPNAVISDLAEIVESDPSLAAQVVSWAASPYYAIPGKIRSVQDAIVRVLGFDLVGNLALGLALGKTLSMPKDKADGITPYWTQSIFCSTLVEAIVKLIPTEQKPGKGLTYLSGLLHNFGYLVLGHIFPPHFSQICRYMEANPDVSHMVIEHHLLQITREQICVWLMDLWNMPEEIGTAIQYQHDPNYSGPHCAYPNLIFIALRLLRQHGIGDAPSEEIPEYLLDRYGLEREQVEEVTERVIESREEIEAIANNFGD